MLFLKRSFLVWIAGPVAVALVGCLASAAAFEPHHERNVRPPDMIKQYQTAMNMVSLSRYIEFFQEENKIPPPSLRAVLREYGVDERLADDEWGRPFYYYASSNGFILASFGKSGQPRPQSVPPGYRSPVGDYDANIVMVNGDWAQRPMEQ